MKTCDGRADHGDWVTLAETTAIRVVDDLPGCHIARSVRRAGGYWSAMTSQTPIEIVTTLLDEFARGDVPAALETIDDDIAYTNVSLPTIRGKRKVAGVLGGVARKESVGFNYRMINVSADDTGVVLTERVDELRFGRLHLQFWVCGRFEVREGRITVWRDYFDYFDMTKALVRGVAALAVPSVQRPLPAPALSA